MKMKWKLQPFTRQAEERCAQNIVSDGVFTTFFCSAVQGQGTAGVNDHELDGSYAFSFSGSTGMPASRQFMRLSEGSPRTAPESHQRRTGIPTASASEQTLTAQAFTGTYSIGADHRGY